MLSQRLSQKMLQKLSPQQIQLMKLLQVPTASLEQRIKEELEKNPALEEGSEEYDSEDEFSDVDDLQDDSDYDEESSKEDELDMDDYLDEESYDYGSGGSYQGDDDNKTIPIPFAKSFHDTLFEQLSFLDLNEEEYIIANQIVGSIDDDGYMRREVDAIMDDLAFSLGVSVTEEQIEQVLKQIQTFEPAGVGARDLRECLLLQLERRKETKPTVEMAIQVLEDNFEAFSKKHYDRLLKQLNVDEEILKEVLDEITRLNPKPGGSSSGGAGIQQIVIPDFSLLNNNGELEVLLNSKNAPELRVSDSFKDMIKDYQKSKVKDKKQKEALLFVKQKIDSAKWFIDAIRQRQNTLLLTMNAIVEYQKDYFLTGDETQLRPMILKDIAEITDLDISTISRVANSKYIQTEFGTFLLKSFFSESLQTDSGEEVSTREVKKIMQDLIDEENKQKPMSDEQITQALKEKGYNIARRTVAKYREQLNIPVARLRKEL